MRDTLDNHSDLNEFIYNEPFSDKVHDYLEKYQDCTKEQLETLLNDLLPKLTIDMDVEPEVAELFALCQLLGLDSDEVCADHFEN